MSDTADHTWPDIADAQFARELSPLAIVQGWARAYREGPRDARFPSDPDAEFFPRDMDMVAGQLIADEKLIVALTSERDALDKSHVDIARRLADAGRQIESDAKMIAALREAIRWALGEVADADGVMSASFRVILGTMFLLWGVAGLLWATMPDDALPSMTWRFHFGIGEMLFGASSGVWIGHLISKRS